MKTKKIISMVLALSLMTGCSGKESSQAQTTSMTRPMLLENISEEYDYKTLLKKYGGIYD